MKYLLTESRLDELVQNFISESTGLLEIHIHPSPVVRYVWYTDSNGIKIFEMIDNGEGFELGVLESLFSSVENMFLLSERDTKRAFMIWMRNYNGMKFPSGVVTF
jgi:hypothetical protein